MKNIRLIRHDLRQREFWTACRDVIEAGAQAGSGGIAFLGDSLTQLGPWDLMFPHAQTRNFGIGGERAEHVLMRLAPVIAVQPEKLFLLIGTNDVALDVAADQIVANVDGILATFAAELPACRLYLQSLPPRAARYATRIRALNALLAQLAARRAISFIDLFPVFDDGTGKICKALSGDELHFSGAGYRAWREAIQSYVEE